MASDELRDGLMTVGLTQYEADTYVALLELGSASAVDVAQAAGVPRARIYDVIRSLAEDGYVETYDDGGLRAQIIKPDQVRDELDEAASQLESTAEQIDDLWEQPAITNRQISVVKRFDTLYRIVRERISEAEFEVKIAATPGQYEQLSDALATAREEGIVVKLTVHGGDSQQVGDPAELRDLVGDLPTETRLRDLPSSLLVVIDHQEVVFAPSHNLSVGEQGLFFDDVWFAEMADWFFRTAMWAIWEPIQTTRQGRTPASYTDIRECLRLVGPHVESGDTVTVRVQSFEDPTHVVEGTIETVTYRQSEGDGSPLEPYVAVAGMTIRTDDDVVSVGNWDAVLEEIPAGMITILDIEG